MSKFINIIILGLLIIVIVLLVLFGTNLLYMNKKQSQANNQEQNLPKVLIEPVIICKNGHKFIIYKNQIVQILDTHNKPAICKDNTTHIDGE